MAEHLIRGRAAVLANCTKLQHFVRDFKIETGTIEELETRLQRLEKYSLDFEKWQTEIERRVEGIKMEDEDRRRLEFEDLYLSVKAKLTKLVNTLRNKDARSVPSPTLSTQGTACLQDCSQLDSVKLPNMKIETFTGEYRKWGTFRDMFNSLIHNNPRLSKVTKFLYLKSYLSGKAAKAVDSLEITDTNYDVAYEILFTKYEDKRLIVQDHLSELLNAKQCKKDSVVELSNLIEEFQTHVRALQCLSVPVDTWDIILIYIFSSKLDSESRKVWETHVSSVDKPTLKEMIECLNNRVKLLETINHASSYGVKCDKVVQSKNGSKQSKLCFTSAKASCSLCKGDHHITRCSDFLKLSTEQRCEQVKHLSLCFKCLHSNHFVQQCRAKACSKCERNHHVLLHFKKSDAQSQDNIVQSNLRVTGEEFVPRQNNQSSGAATEAVVSGSQCHFVRKDGMQVLLATAIVYVEDADGNKHECRVLLDNGSQSNFITENLCQRLKLKKEKIWTPVIGINQVITNMKYRTNALVLSRVSDYQAVFECLVLPKISNTLPLKRIDISRYNLPDHIKLADPQFYEPGRIDMLIGAEIYNELLRCKQIVVSSELPPLQETVLGFILVGKVRQTVPSVPSVSLVSMVELNDQLKRFWQIEEFQENNNHSIEEKLCEEHYVKNIKRDMTGRFSVSLPTRSNVLELGESRESALKQFHSLEKRFVRDPDLKAQYVNFMKEYVQLGHMRLVDTASDTNNRYYIPHHAVVKPTSSTTKLRVVFNASNKSSSGLSLNDVLMVGPTVQQTLLEIILRFRRYMIVLTGDIAKMYRQIEVHPEQRHLQSILWRSSSSEPVHTYELNTVTYGTACAPYLATRTLNQIANIEVEDFPRAAVRVSRDFYVDDLLTGADTVEEVVALRQELTTLLARGGFEIRKWSSNHQQVVESIPERCRDVEYEQTCILGLVWRPQDDEFLINLCNFKQCNTFTKRIILSEIARLYDPLGLCGPVVFKAKTLMQRLWTINDIAWDNELPEGIQREWSAFRDELSCLNKIHIPRCIVPVCHPTRIELHGFSDASERGYAACVYVRCSGNNQIFNVRLVSSKSRVAPLKKLTIPRLELCGALLLAQLLVKIEKALETQFDEKVFWTDSKIVIAYINSTPSRFPTFVANRIAQIQELSEPHQWHHVRSACNPADVLSRGLMPSELEGCDMWWHGPGFLRLDYRLEKDVNNVLERELPEYRDAEVTLNVVQDTDIIDRYSSLLRLLRIVAMCLRFIRNCTVTASNRQFGNITANELNIARDRIIRYVQNREFELELKCIRANSLSVKSKLKSLNPFIDADGILRVGGRLENSKLTFENKHQILLPATSGLSKLIVEHEHVRSLHAAPQALINLVRQRYWILNIRNLAKVVVRNCVRCFRTKPPSVEQLMGQLPAPRVQQSRPFLNVGVDFCGPFNVRYKIRSKVLSKAYICIFICLAIKAVHMELVEDLSADAFLAALKRFTSRRGLCKTIWSDNATNFVGANNKLREIYESISIRDRDRKIETFCVSQNIQWRFIPPRSPHVGGLWESAVKSAKYHLSRVMGTTVFTTEELRTLVVQIEGCLNSRPITAASDDPNDLMPLTPGHFLIGHPLMAVLEEDVTDVKVSRLSRWQHVQQTWQHFWKRWSLDYLNQLQQRKKWRSVKQNVREGLLVLLKDNNTLPMTWTMGRIIEIFPGKDGKVRVVKIKTSKGHVKRAITQICIFPSTCNNVVNCI